MTKIVYLCGPITGLTYEQATDERERMVTLFKDRGVEALSPMRGKIFLLEARGELLKAKGYDNVMTSGKGIVGRDRNDVLSSDVIFADFRGATKASIGSCVEFGWADAWRKPIVTLMEKTGNAHDHAFIHEMSTYVVDDVGEAVDLTLLLLNAR